MSFLFPAFLIGALAVAVPIVLHLLRRDVAPEHPFTAVKLLRRSPIERTRRRRLRDLLLLAARVAALLLLAAAFARPYMEASGAADRLRVIAIDRSYSMSAPGRFERALALAREAAGADARVAVIAFDDRAEVVLEPAGPAQAREAIGTLQRGFGRTRYAPVLDKAIELAGAAPATLVLVTDMQRAGWENEEPRRVPANLEVELQQVDGPRTNLAVVGVAIRPDGVVATILNAGSQPATGDVRLLLDGRIVATGTFAAGPGESAEAPVAHAIPASGTVTVEIDDPEGYASDNARYAVLDGNPATRVVVVGSGEGAASGFYVSRALMAAGGDDVLDVRRMAGAQLGKAAEEELSTARAVVLLTTRSLDRRARDGLAAFVRAGGGVVLAAGPDVEPPVVSAVLGVPLAVVEEDSGAAALAATDLRHPVFRPFGPLAANIGAARFTRSWRVREDGWSVVARFTNGAPALLDRTAGEGRVLLFASDMDRRWNDFPLHPAFAPFTVEAVRYVAAAEDARREYLVADAPPAVPGAPGVYTMGEGKRVAVNVDPRESSPSAMPSQQFAAMLQLAGEEPAARRERRAQELEANQNLWRYGLMLMLAVLVVESAAGRIR